MIDSAHTVSDSAHTIFDSTHNMIDSAHTVVGSGHNVIDCPKYDLLRSHCSSPALWLTLLTSPCEIACTEY